MNRDERKFKELILYVAQSCECDDTFGATKLNKILFYADLTAYVELGQSITGEEYQKLERGPAPRRLLPVQSKMQESRECAIQTRKHFGHDQKRLIALRDADLSVFMPQEIAIVDRVIQHFQGRTARDVSELSHNFIGWDVVAFGETIPFGTIFVSPEPLTDEEKRLGMELKPTLATTPS